MAAGMSEIAAEKNGAHKILSTKLSRYAEAIMEAAWLAAVIVVPVFFNIYSSRIFEPDKITLLRTLVLVILAGWIIKLVESGGLRWDLIQPGQSWWKAVLKIPLIAPVAALALTYLISTILSITPRISFFGSYQRLQGAYTTFSYLVIFAAMAVNLRRRVQVERLIGAVVISSLPVSLYGVLQRNGLDPIPWGGDVTSRIAANMGNSIFVAAYLIMVFPLTLMRIVESFEALLTDRGFQGPNFVRATGYVFILALQAIAIYYSGSRGPWLGWAASLVFIWLGLSLIWRTRWLTISGVVVAVIAAVFLILFNIPNGPFEEMRTRPEFYRLGQLLDTESRTGQVRSLIWGGASELVAPHEPLEFPDGGVDHLNAIRPLIGYGPESMYVAYNRFYPPELTQVEKRNASPDRSHNETWDSLVITGALGLVAYLALFGFVIYYGLKWLGLVQSERQRYLFLGLSLTGGALSSLVFVLWQDWGYLGVALPFGMILGVIVYLLLVSLFGNYQAPQDTDQKLRAYILLALVSSVVAHWVEINFGIAIVATRTYFWVYSALILLVGYILPQYGKFGALSEELEGPNVEGAAGQKTRRKSRAAAVESRGAKGRKKRRRDVRGFNRDRQFAFPGWLREALIAGFLVAVLLITLGFDFLTNIGRAENAASLIWNSLTVLDGNASYGLLAMVITAWLVGVVVLVSEQNQQKILEAGTSTRTWLKILAVALGVSMLIGSVYWLWHAGGLISLAESQATTMDELMQQVRRSENILTRFYVFLLLIVFGLGLTLPIQWPSQQTRFKALSAGLTIVALLIAFSLASYFNLRVIQADIAFKTADLFAGVANWPPAIAVYNRALELAPNEDYYYLFLGRAYLEHAKSLDDPDERDNFISRSAQDLEKAQQINPLNTDHTANLARLHTLWAAAQTNPQRRLELAGVAEDYFAAALMLSPNNAALWNEWATLYLNILGLPPEAIDRLETALDLDPYFDRTYYLLGDYYYRYVASDTNLPEESRLTAKMKAAEFYAKAVELAGSDSAKVSYLAALAAVQTELGMYEQAIQSYEEVLLALGSSPDVWQVYEKLAILYYQIGDIETARTYANQTLALAPTEEQERLLQMFGPVLSQP